MKYRWIEIPVLGFVYYEAMVIQDGQTIGWNTLADGSGRYVSFYCDGQRIHQTTRGSAHNAREWLRATAELYGQ